MSKKLDNLTKEELEVLKLKYDVNKSKIPFWKNLSFISIIVTLLVAFAGTSVTIWRIKSDRIVVLEQEKEKLSAAKKKIEKLYSDAIHLSQKTEIKSGINTLNETQLELRERQLKKDIESLETEKERIESINIELRKQSKAYKRDFVNSYMKNDFVQKDLDVYLDKVKRKDAEYWIKSKLLWTALVNYENHLKKNQKKGHMNNY
jgi:hypothetical protein